MGLRVFLAAVIAVWASGTALAVDHDYGKGNARVRLVASTERERSGDPVFLGVQFDIRPGWHIYWKNPGGAGLATGIDWRLPVGVTAGDLQWPLPVGFTQSGDIPGYGYEGSVVLAARLQPPAALVGNAVVGASVTWLACKDVCVLGSAELEETWAKVEIDRGFAAWQDSLPQTIEAADAPFTLTIKGGLGTGTIGLWLQWRVAPQTVEWFPDPSDGLEVEDVTIQTRGGLTRVDAIVREMAGSKTGHEALDSVVVITDENNRRRGWNVAVDLKQESK